MSDPVPLRGTCEQPPAADPVTIDVVYNHLKDVTERQFGDAKDLDDKMIKVFTAGSVVIGLSGLSTPSIPGRQEVRGSNPRRFTPPGQKGS